MTLDKGVQLIVWPLPTHELGKGQQTQFTLIRIIAGGGAITIWYHLACLEAVEALPTTETSVKSVYRPFTHLGALS